MPSTFNNAGFSLVAQRKKHLPAMQETQVRSLGWEDPLEKEMATHSSILAWRILGTEEPERATVHRVEKSRTRLSHFTSLHFTSISKERVNIQAIKREGLVRYVTWLDLRNTGLHTDTQL